MGDIKRSCLALNILASRLSFYVTREAASENPKIKACDRDESGVYTKVMSISSNVRRERNAEFGVFGGCREYSLVRLQVAGGSKSQR